MKMITIAGMISSGKSSLTQMVSDRYNSLAKYEEIPEILSKWYGDARVVTDGERIPFLTQLTFLTQRMNAIRSCRLDKSNGFAVLDRSIFEDRLFAILAHEDGGISDSEMEVYDNLLNTMWKELDMIPKISPDCTFYIRISWETFRDRIFKRGRKIETDNFDVNEAYFHKLWSRYDEFMQTEYVERAKCPVIIIDGDKYDFVESDQDRKEVMDIIHRALIECGVVEEERKESFVYGVLGSKVHVTAPWFNREGITEAVVHEVFTDHKGDFILNCRVNGRHNQISLYKGQYKFIGGIYND